MSLVASVYSTDRYPRSAKDALKMLRGESDLECSARPEPTHKLIRAALERDADGSTEPQVSKLFGWVSQQALVRGIERDKPIVLLMDGQESLWTAASHFLPDQANSIEIPDIIHVSSHLWQAVNAIYRHGSKRAKQRFEHYLLRILEGDVERVIGNLKQVLRAHNISLTKREQFTSVCNYMLKNKHRMAYDRYLREGYPIATGVIEGACRCVVKDRLERSGMRWVLNGANAMLGLRCIRASGLWKQFIDYRIRRATETSYANAPAANNNEYASTTIIA